MEIGILGSYTISEGTFEKLGEDERYEHFRIGATQGSGVVTNSILADPIQSVARRKSDSAICVITVYNAPACKENADYKMTKKPYLDDNSFQQVLIYNGRTGDTINVGYREFSNDTARPAFSNEIQYDLSVSDVVGYQNARIRVIQATNTSIRYVVIQNFNQAAL
jgi:hypothetical protein